MDFWAQRCLEELREAEEQNVPAAHHTTDRAMADTVMDFLFASQDATTSAVVWVTVLMAEYPLVLEKVTKPLYMLHTQHNFDTLLSRGMQHIVMATGSRSALACSGRQSRSCCSSDPCEKVCHDNTS